VPRVVAIIFHPGPAPDAGPLTAMLATIRRRNADRHAEGFRRLGAAAILVEDASRARSFGQRLRRALADVEADGVVVLGSGAIPLAGDPERRLFLRAAGGPAGHALANNRYSADVVAIAGSAPLGRLRSVATDNALPRWLEETAGYEVDDLRSRWRLQVDLDTPLDALLIQPETTARGPAVDADLEPGTTEPVRRALAGVATATRDPRRELLVAGRLSAAGLTWLERSTASRTRALGEERGFRTRADDQRPVRSTLGLVLDRDGPEALGVRLAELADAALIDTRVLLAHRFGADEAGWPSPEDRYASDLLLPDGIADPWLRALTASAANAPIPVVLGGHSLVGPGLRLVLRPRISWT
jgi:hypothetical protein